MPKKSSKLKTKKEVRLTRNLITREEAIRLSPAYVQYVESSGVDDAWAWEKMFKKFEKLKVGQDVLTAYVVGFDIQWVKGRVTSIDHDDIRAVDGPVVRVGNSEYTWRCDGDKYAWPL